MPERSIGRRLWPILTIPLAVVLTIFAIANRQPVTVDLWPFQMAVMVPLFVVVLGAMVFGLLVGAVSMWLPLLGWRRRTRRRDRRIVELQTALERAEAKPGAVPAAPAPPEPPPVVIAP